MLIRGIRAKNFMKFRRLVIEDIPGEGLLGIEGQNEGGKSTVGELLQFTLFGKSLSSQASSLHDLIHWDEDECSVDLDFEIPSGADAGQYRIYRQIDSYGTNYARITDADSGREVATGLLQVEETMTRLLRFRFDDYVRSFYLSETEYPRSPEQFRQFLDRMLGVDQIVGVADEVKREIQDHEGEFSKLQTEIKRNQQQIEKYLPNLARIPEVELSRDEHRSECDRLAAEEKEIERTLDTVGERIRSREAQRDRLRSLVEKPAARFREGVDHLLEAYPSGNLEPLLESSRKDVEKLRSRLQELRRVAEQFDQVESAVQETDRQLRARLEGSGQDSYRSQEDEARAAGSVARRKRAFNKGAGVILTLLAVAAGAFAVGLNQQWFGEAPAFLGDWTAQQGSIGAGVGAGVLLLLAIIFLVRSSSHGGGVRESESRLGSLESSREADQGRLDKIAVLDTRAIRVNEVHTSLSATGVEQVDKAVGGYQDSFQKALGDKSDLAALCAQLAEDEGRVVQRLKSAHKTRCVDLEKSREAHIKEKTKFDRAENEIREYEKQAGRKANLEEQSDGIRVKADLIRAQIETRQLTLQLLDETVESVRHRAGPSLGKTMRRLLPSLTGGRYKDLKITPEFKLQLFTSDKSDFLAPHELSGGTFEGLSLGFRLAFSQAFIHAVVRSPQFLFLDEPFKAMDVDRVHLTLKALMSLSPELRQIFVVIPSIRDGDRSLFDRIFRVKVGQSELENRALSHPAAGMSEDLSPIVGDGEGREEPPREPAPLAPPSPDPEPAEVSFGDADRSIETDGDPAAEA